MNQNQFELAYQKQWDRFQRILDALESKENDRVIASFDPETLPMLYRRLCNQYGLALTRHYSPALVDRLHNLILRGHRQLYKRRTNLFWTATRFLARDFPQTLRKNYLAFWLAFILFSAPAAAIGVATYQDPVLIYSLMSEGQVIEMESMYNPENRLVGRGANRGSETDLTMFGYYILNNISIGFRTFASGIIFGVGSVFYLIFNGLMIGGVAGHLSHPPYVLQFWQFISGHGAFELTAIIISGAAGLLLGYSLIAPGRYRRIDSLRRTAPTALLLVIGASLMLVLAAFIEAFWSSSGFSPEVKFSVAVGNWVVVILYLLFAGSRRHES